MTNNGVSQERDQDRILRDVLGRYGQRFEPSEPEWGRIEARRAALAADGAETKDQKATRPGPERRLFDLRSWSRMQLVAMAAVAAVLALVAVAIAPINIEFGNSRAQATGTPREPIYMPVPRANFLPGSTMAAIQARGFIRVGVKADQPGFGLRDPKTGAYSGFDVEIAKLMALGIFGGDGDMAHLGTRILFVPVVSKNREAVIEAGTVDIVIATYTINADRKTVVDFAGPYFLAGQDIMTRADDDSIRGPGDLNGKKVCTVRGTTSLTNLLGLAPDAKVTLEDTFSACAADMKARKVAAVTTDGAILDGLVLASGYTFKRVNNPFSREPYGIGLKKGDETFRSFLNARLMRIESNNDWTLAHSYALQQIETEAPPPIAQ